VALAEPLDVVDFVRRLEEALIRVVHDLGVTGAGRVAGAAGCGCPPTTAVPSARSPRSACAYRAA
jgi:lipoyl(octanoyl) transferase